jgi:diguanylate cyclase (GGDEF)-like protein
MDSASIALDQGANLEITASGGPLAQILSRIGTDDLARLAALVDGVASCYTAGDSTGAGFVGTDALRAAGARAVAVVPLVAAGRRLGILVTASVLPTSFDPADAETVEVLGAHVASCLDRATLFTRLRDATERDALTGLWNRGAFDDHLSELMQIAADDTWAVLLADIDRFKTVNDNSGHFVGDEILRAVGASLESSINAGSRAFRIGGDEFAVLIGDVDVDGAMAIARRGVDAADEVLHQHGASLSGGVAIRAEHEDRATLLKRADRALYEAKRNGLRVRLASGPGESGGRSPVAKPDRVSESGERGYDRRKQGRSRSEEEMRMSEDTPPGSDPDRSTSGDAHESSTMRWLRPEN